MAGAPGAGWARAWRRLLRKVREVSVFHALALGVGRILPPRLLYLGRTLLLEIRPLTDAPGDEQRGGIRWAGSEDSPRLQAFGHSLDLVRQRLAAGDRACMLTDDERLLGYVWFHKVQHQEEVLGVRFHLGPGEIWLFDAMVAPDQRGRGLYPRLLRAAARDLGREGIGRILIAIEASNRNSIRAHIMAGAEIVGHLRVLRILGFTVVHDGRAFRAAWTGAEGWLDLPSACAAG